MHVQVHVKSPHNARYQCGLTEAVDVVTDALLLAACKVLVHIDSNVTSAVSYLSPDLEMLHVVDLLASDAGVHDHDGQRRTDERGGSGGVWGGSGVVGGVASAVRVPSQYVQAPYMASAAGALAPLLAQAEAVLARAHVERARQHAAAQLEALYVPLVRRGEAAVDEGIASGHLTACEVTEIADAAERLAAIRGRLLGLAYAQALTTVGRPLDACEVLQAVAAAFVCQPASAARRHAAALRACQPLPATAGYFLREVYHHWGAAAAAASCEGGAGAVFELAVVRGVWAEPLQRPLDHYLPSLTCRPIWDGRALEAARALERAYPTILHELRGLMGEGAAAFSRDDGGPGDGHGGAHARLVASGQWTDVQLYAGCCRAESNCARCPSTAALIASRPEFNGVVFGSHFFSRLAGGSHLSAHCGPSNFRLRCHLGLLVPPGARIRVGREVREWRAGECLIFDDSYEHEVWHEGSDDRVVLVCDMWHPQLDLDTSVLPLLSHRQRRALDAAQAGAHLPLHAA